LILTVNGHYPPGNYTILFDGEGKISVNSPTYKPDVVEEAPGRLVVALDPARSRGAIVSVVISETNPANHIRNIRVLLPGHESELQGLK